MSSELHFLVVDDLSTIRHIIITLLKGLGCTKVSEAEDGEQALNLLQSADASDTPVNFLVTDWNMPIMDGITLLRRIRASINLRHLPVLLVTSEAGNDNIIAATQAGVDGYIAKPALNARILKETIEHILKQRAASP